MRGALALSAAIPGLLAAVATLGAELPAANRPAVVGSFRRVAKALAERRRKHRMPLRIGDLKRGLPGVVDQRRAAGALGDALEQPCEHSLAAVRRGHVH